MNDPENGRIKGGAEGQIKSNNKQRILGPEWSMSQVVTPQPHNSDKPHGPVYSINNNNSYGGEGINTLVASTIAKALNIKKYYKRKPKDNSELDSKYNNFNFKNIHIWEESDFE